MDDKIRQMLKIPSSRLEVINDLLLDPEIEVINDFLEIVSKFGTPDEINQKARSARQLPNLMEKVRTLQPDYLKDLEWLNEQKKNGAFISVPEYRRKILGSNTKNFNFNEDFAVTLEISALQYFPWVISAAERAVEQKSIMPGRFIQVRKMKEQASDGDLPAIAAAMEIIGASYVETLDTKGTDGSNIHLGGPETITGYFGGIGQPNHYALKWLEECLYYYTNWGIKQVLNINPGTVLLGYFLFKIGVDLDFKISVFMGNDNPYAAFWTLLAAKLFSREDGSCPLIGFNWSNSVDNQTIELAAEVRKELGFEDIIRFEHHITETYKSIVRQPYNRRQELIDLADHIPNISAKHEGGDPELDSTRNHPSDILDYFRDKDEVISSGDWENLEQNFMDKFDACNRTAEALTRAGLSFIAAQNLHSS